MQKNNIVHEISHFCYSFPSKITYICLSLDIDFSFTSKILISYFTNGRFAEVMKKNKKKNLVLTASDAILNQ